MFKIGEFSKLTQVSIRMLRYYDEAGLLTPAATDRFTNYRLYAAEQIPALNKIIFLRDLGFNVSEIAIALNHWEDGFISKLLEDKRLEIENVIKAEQEKLSKIELAKNDILREKMAINYNVSIKSIPSYQVFSLRRIVPDYYAEGQLWKEMSAFADKNNIPVSSDTFTIYHDRDYREKDVDMEICAPVARMGENINGFVFRNTEPVPNMACMMVYGPFENIAGAFLAFASWLQEHNQYKMIGQSRQIVHCGPWNEECPDKYLTEIQIPLERI
ncbi:MerR family transcriptional regulator [Lacrimispora sphenoides]|uniref:DNA-binding transcriptional regulator, MerR family n=1 Tax=Lacrimispora sphenoides JCM 1415 TaxID=1297793 RepID=A0ABY1CFZ0_9FIRM|nr:effector binding domain-containing protein [Lacrimispora sphenoides]SEU01609.1 DNA-binding transcriptional regulator, MerR family [[Clostridium] sphenoides JCM 1415]SUY53275.1 MerR family transcriptional regulator [Lacrimispora sphenoides]